MLRSTSGAISTPARPARVPTAPNTGNTTSSAPNANPTRSMAPTRVRIPGAAARRCRRRAHRPDRLGARQGSDHRAPSRPAPPPQKTTGARHAARPRSRHPVAASPDGEDLLFGCRTESSTKAPIPKQHVVVAPSSRMDLDAPARLPPSGTQRRRQRRSRRSRRARRAIPAQDHQGDQARACTTAWTGASRAARSGRWGGTSPAGRSHAGAERQRARRRTRHGERATSPPGASSASASPLMPSEPRARERGGERRPSRGDAAGCGRRRACRRQRYSSRLGGWAIDCCQA